MDLLINDYNLGLIAAAEPPCLSLYQPTHRVFQDKQQDPIRFRNLLRELEESLRREYSTRDVRPLIEPFERLAEDSEFWRMRTLDGLAVLAAPDFFRVYRFQRPVPELAVVADSFHIKPLVRLLQSADGYYVLSLDRQQIRLFEGNRDRLDEVELAPGVPRTSAEAQGEEDRERHFSTWSPGGDSGSILYGKGSQSEIVDADAERFFRALDHAILEQYSRPSGRPLLLAALPENQSLFRRLSRNPLLLDEEIDINPNALSLEELRDRAWQAVEPHYLTRLSGLIESFKAMSAHELGDADLERVARSAVAGRVKTLLIDADRHIPGRFDAMTGEITYDDLSDPAVGDLLDDLGQIVLKLGGQIVIVPAERMPTDTGIAATYRF
ncbi:MAG: hypothetical protein D8M57_07075 [Candidatus Scalindua sp. AMX11]|nr:MAG: hypothetical protein DWQ00_14645 [Candidatus Scalindua sp.]NOG85677.1 hypothetical protein [Planctomycetota bacterium]RZV82430.1 MAG: hypothetical protein EX341_09675 [Candidatus Scalindua sp. SCAELEC01]TDE65648.1 MAG: hypothetical protein D8M57_07075 [Candidatus Scalindua sp. AMX11]GJQ59154.1 MAG: hypothetical protein SCALA701_19550 [Candidatus Scalindua sp.]